jgi:chromosome segregation ATPase
MHMCVCLRALFASSMFFYRVCGSSLDQLLATSKTKLEAIKSFERLLQEAQEQIDTLETSKKSTEMKIHEIQLDNERLHARERERAGALQELQKRNTTEMASIQLAEQRLHKAIDEERRLRQLVANKYNSTMDAIRKLKIEGQKAAETNAEDESLKQQLRTAHTALEQALVEQETHLHALLEVLPAFDRCASRFLV